MRFHWSKASFFTLVVGSSGEGVRGRVRVKVWFLFVIGVKIVISDQNVKPWTIFTLVCRT